MIKRFMVILLVLSVLVLRGCTYSREKQPSSGRMVIQMSNQIMEALQQNDKQMLRELFCPYMKENYFQLDEEINKLYEFIDGEIVSYDEPRPSPFSGKSKLGEGCVEQYTFPKIENIKTSNDQVYTIIYKYHLIDKERPTYEGISIITIRKVNEVEEKFKIKFTEMWE